MLTQLAITAAIKVLRPRSVSSRPWMIDPYPKLARLKELYPADIAGIEQDERRGTAVARHQSHAIAGGTRRETWHIIDARLWFIKMVAKDYTSELEKLDRELEAELMP